MAPRLILTGFMATGKSAVARAMARRLAWPLFDCDAAVVARARMPIAEIFRTHGEAFFRTLEREVIAALAAAAPRCPQCGEIRPAVIATGGGAIVDPVNYEALARAGVIICLTARPEVIVRRLGRSIRSRPMLTQGGKSVRERVAELLEARRAAYGRAAITIDTSNLDIDQVVETIIDRVAALTSEGCRLSA
ncbi:MAG TPA: shikimate kinase [Candidatus Binataceae bacterium]|nr:shikimate kinase [Candidatus Binataceae bacterium]